MCVFVGGFPGQTRTGVFTCRYLYGEVEARHAAESRCCSRRYVEVVCVERGDRVVSEKVTVQISPTSVRLSLQPGALLLTVITAPFDQKGWIKIELITSFGIWNLRLEHESLFDNKM